MPTSEQLDLLWESEFEFKTNVPSNTKPVTKFTGKTIGHFEYDAENDDIKIVVDEDKDDEDVK